MLGIEVVMETTKLVWQEYNGIVHIHTGPIVWVVLRKNSVHYTFIGLHEDVGKDGKSGDPIATPFNCS